MKNLKKISAGVVLVFLLASANLFAQNPASPDVIQRVTDVIKKSDDAVKAKNFDELKNCLHPQFCHPVTMLDRDKIIDLVKMQLANLNFTECSSKIKTVITSGEYLIANIDCVQKWKTNTGQDGSEIGPYVYVLKPDNNELKILTYAKDIDQKKFDPQTRIFRNVTGGYSLNVPKGWVPVSSEVLGSIATDNIVALAPDFKSFCMLGFIQMPINMKGEDPAKVALEADEAGMKRAYASYESIEKGPVTINGLSGYKSLSVDPAKGERKRMRIYFSKGSIVYFFVCDGIPAVNYETYKKGFEEMVMSFKLIQEGEISSQERIAAEYSKGSISGRTYTNQEYNCFIAAPPNWTIRTSPNPMHLAEMQANDSKTIARLIAAKELMGQTDLDKIYQQRFDQISAAVKGFKEISRQKSTIQNVPCIISVQQYSVEQLGDFEVKEVSLIKDGKYYMILCQAIKPDTLANREKEFDAIIKSFGFIK